MKKIPVKKLSLGKIKIANLSKDHQLMIKAGAGPYPTPNCPTTGIQTNKIKCLQVTACNCPPTKTNCVRK